MGNENLTSELEPVKMVTGLLGRPSPGARSMPDTHDWLTELFCF
jgi:hypothetical protein